MCLNEAETVEMGDLAPQGRLVSMAPPALLVSPDHPAPKARPEKTDSTARTVCRVLLANLGATASAENPDPPVKTGLTGETESMQKSKFLSGST